MYIIALLMDLINDFTTKQNNLYFEMVNLTKFTFKTIQKLISEAIRVFEYSNTEFRNFN